MLIGVPKEIKVHEFRVGLTPENVWQIASRGHAVVVERDAGAGIGASDEDYRAAGAAVAASAEEVFGEAELIVKVKEPHAPKRAQRQAAAGHLRVHREEAVTMPGRRIIAWGASLLLLMPAAAAPAGDSGDVMAARFAREVNMRLRVPDEEQAGYADRLADALSAAGLRETGPQYFLLVDRSPVIQAAFVYLSSPARGWRFIGASPVSTGYAGGFEYFMTPPGVFGHALANMDFRAEGTRNANGILGYGIRGMRVFDFGWIEGERTWGAGGRSPMRLQVHATDPDLLEHHLGRPRSKGCIRIPASLNGFLDRYGILDAEYEQAARQGRHLWVLRPDREPVEEPGMYLVVIDSGRKTRPAWSPWPPRRERVPAQGVPQDGPIPARSVATGNAVPDQSSPC